MARMHSRAKGRSGSTKPIEKTVPSWIKYKPNEIEALIAKLAKEGKKPSQIGMHLRDVYGIPDVKSITKKSISEIVDAKGLSLEMPEDLLSLIRKAALLKKHLEDNHKDKTAIRGLQLTESKIFRLSKYYKESGKIDATWKYDPTKISFYAE
ncbi:30S ribosomal protein S15 [Candidatus Woesearchaeota archaeon]|nr:MAG: 30S ribosomal protein S15 [Candidatus Woesearchaeota archaeon]